VGESRFGSLSGEGEYDKKPEEKKDTPAPTGTGGGKKPSKGFSPAKPGEVKDKPKVVLEQQIPYPAEARKLGIEGKVRLRVDIDKKGRVVKVKVLKDPGGGLGNAAAKAIKGFLFSPAIGLSGKPVDYRITYTYVFKLE
jgi:TonB family protein